MARILGYTSVQGLSTQIKNSYARVILPYEDFCERGRNTPFSPPQNSNSKPPIHIQTPGKAPRSSATPAEDDSTVSSPLTASSSPLSEPPDESELKEQGPHSRRSARQDSFDQTSRECICTIFQNHPLRSPQSRLRKQLQHPRLRLSCRCRHTSMRNLS